MKRADTVSVNRLLITQQEMVLTKYSNEAKDTGIYGNLFDCLEQYKKLSKRDLQQNIIFDDKARVVLLNSDNKKIMMANILKEWHSVKEYDISDAKISCQLCGRPNKYIFYIHNNITDIDLNIGSDCVKNFHDITGIRQQRRKLAQMQKEHGEQKRKIEFEILEGNEVAFLQESEVKFKSFKIMLPYKIYCEIKDTLCQLNLAKSSYIKSGGYLESIFDRYTYLKLKFNDLYNKAEIYYNTVKDSLLICDKDTSDWLLVNNQLLWESVAKNNGLFNVEALRKVYLNSYVEHKLFEFRKHLNDPDIKIIQCNGNSIKFSVQNVRYIYPITFTITIKKFMETIGCYCLTKLDYKFGRDDLQEVSIENTKSNFETLYNSVFSVLSNHGYDFIIEEKTSQAYWKKLPYYERKAKWSNHTNQISAIYKKSDINMFLSVLSSFLLKDEITLERNFEVIVKKMECGRTWITQKEKDISEQITKDARGLQKQKEFIPY